MGDEDGVRLTNVSVTYSTHTKCEPKVNGGIVCNYSYPLEATQLFDFARFNGSYNYIDNNKNSQKADIQYLYNLEVSVKGFDEDKKANSVYVAQLDEYGVYIDNDKNIFNGNIIMPYAGADINSFLDGDDIIYAMNNTLNKPLMIKDKQEITIDLQGTTLSSLEANALIIDKSKVTIKNGTISSDSGDTVVIKNGSDVSFENVTIIHEGNNGVPLRVEDDSNVSIVGKNNTLTLKTSSSSSGSIILSGSSSLSIGTMSYLKGDGDKQFIKVEDNGSQISFEDGSFFEMDGDSNGILIRSNEDQVVNADKVDLVFDGVSYKKEVNAQAPIESVEQDENENATNNNESFKDMLEGNDDNSLVKYISKEDKPKIEELKEQASQGDDSARIYVEIESSPMNMNAVYFQSDIELINGDQDIKEAEGKLVNLVNIDAKLKVDVEVGNITSSKEVKLSSLPEEAIITIYLPLDNYDPNKTYQVVRVHGEEVTLLNTTVGSVDYRGLPLTFASDLFSTYGVVEVNKQTGGNDPGSDGDQGGSQIDPPRIPSSPSHSYTDKDLPSNTKECQKEFGDEYIWSDEYDACVIKFMIVDTATR